MCKGPEVERTQRLAQIRLKELAIILSEDGFEFVSNKLLRLKMGGFLDMCFFSKCRSHHEEGLVLSIPGQGTHFQIQHSPKSQLPRQVRGSQKSKPCREERQCQVR